MMFKKCGLSKFAQMRFKNVTKERVNVQGRLQTSINLVAEEPVYQRTRYQKFLSNEGQSNLVGKPFNADSSNAFNKLCLLLESEAGTDLLTLHELQEKMERFSEINDQMKHTQPSG